MVFDIFSKRNKPQGGQSDVYQYDNIPQEARVQIVHLWQRAIGMGEQYTSSRDAYNQIINILREEYGVFHLCGDNNHLYGINEIVNFFLKETKIERCLDVIELSLRCVRANFRDKYNISYEEAEAIINSRLREAAVGYQHENGNIIKVNQQLIHSEIVKPAIIFLSNKIFKGANDEFMSAHKNYRSGAYKAWLVDALKSFESTMKIVCKAKDWTPEGDTASKLIATLFSNNFIPQYLQTQFNALKSVLESGIPTIRNKTAGHGQGDQIQEVPEYLAAYILHQTASAILFIAKAYEEKP